MLNGGGAGEVLFAGELTPEKERLSLKGTPQKPIFGVSSVMSPMT